MPEQRNPYQGNPARAWLRVELAAADGSLVAVGVVADSGNPFFLIVGSATLRQFKRRKAPAITTNFGVLEGGWLQVRIPSTGVDQLVLGFGSDAVAAACQRTSPDFRGLAGLPLLRLVEYGGDAQAFWVRAAGVLP